MKLGLRELRRKPGRFSVVGGALVLLMILLLLLGGLLDGLVLGSTGAYRAQQADVFVYSSEARQSFQRSRIDADLRADVEQVAGVGTSGGLGVVQVAARVPGEDELADVAVIGYEMAPSGVPEPPAAGQGYADRRLTADGVEEGDVLRLGPAQVPVQVVGFVDDTSYLLQGSLWVPLETWRQVQTASRPDQAVGDGTVQVVVARADGTDPATLAARVDQATGGATETLTRDEAVVSVPGVAEQNGVFSLLIGVTLFAAGLVTTLFFALLVIERITLFATLKALGARNRTLLGGVVAQAVVVAAGAVALGTALTLALTAVVPPAIPLRLEPSRAVISSILLVVTAALGGALSLRRITRIDPATALGGNA